MDSFLEKITTISNVIGDKLEEINDGFAKDAIRQKHKIRIRFYQLVIDYINSPGSETPNAFFEWYLEQLDKRIEKKPDWARAYYTITKQKNEPSFRKFLEKCRDDLVNKPMFVDVIKDWLPTDEHQIISSTSSSDITDVLNIAIDMANDKQDTSDQIMGAIFSNLPLIVIAGFFHWFIFSFVYKSFVTPGFEDRKIWAEMTTVEQNYVIYAWFMEPTNVLIFIGCFVALGMALSWSIKNWNKHFIRLREHYIDYIPPYSLSKINSQYNILMIINNFMKSGKSFGDALDQVLVGASPYIKTQVMKIISNSGAKANDAISIFYLGEYGSSIQERGNHVPLQQAMDGLLPQIKKLKKERFEKTIKITMAISLKPMVYLSFGFSLVPLIAGIFASLPKV